MQSKRAGSIAVQIKQAIEQNRGRRIRIVTDVLSPLLVLNSAESMYRYWTDVITEIKNYDVVFLAFLEEAMHPPNVFAQMEQLFDGVIEMKYL